MSYEMFKLNPTLSPEMNEKYIKELASRFKEIAKKLDTAAICSRYGRKANEDRSELVDSILRDASAMAAFASEAAKNWQSEI